MVGGEGAAGCWATALRLLGTHQVTAWPCTACQSSHSPIGLSDQGTCSRLVPSEMSRAQEPLLIGTVLAGVALVGVLQSKETAGPRSLPETIAPASAGETTMSGVYLDVKDYFSRFHVSLCHPTLPGMVQRVRRGLENGTALTPAPLRADQAVSRSKGNRDRLCMTELLSLDMWALAG